MTEHVLTGTRGAVAVREWPHPRPRFLAVVVHGYGEHAGRYEELAEVLNGHGAAVFAPDHMGHGRSAGERVVIEDFEDVVTDLHAVAELARAAHPDVPLVVIGHSMGGLIAARYAQRHGDALAALVLSGPVIGGWELPGRLLAQRRDPRRPRQPRRALPRPGGRRGVRGGSAGLARADETADAGGVRTDPGDRRRGRRRRPAAAAVAARRRRPAGPAARQPGRRRAAERRPDRADLRRAPGTRSSTRRTGRRSSRTVTGFLDGVLAP